MTTHANYLLRYMERVIFVASIKVSRLTNEVGRILERSGVQVQKSTH
jgi:hypothetical protein